jgi:nuclear pore complex protein Nup62
MATGPMLDFLFKPQGVFVQEALIPMLQQLPAWNRPGPRVGVHLRTFELDKKRCVWNKYVCTHENVCFLVDVSVSVYVFVYMYVYVYVYVYVCKYVCMFVCMYVVCMYVCMYVCLHVFIVLYV